MSGKRWKHWVKDGKTGGDGDGGVTQFSRDSIEHDSNKNKMLRPYVWAVTGSFLQNFSVTLQGSFFFPSLVQSCSFSLKPQTALHCGLTPSFNLLHNVPPHWKNSCCFCVCTSVLCISEGLRLLFSVCTDWSVFNSMSILLLPETPLALNNTSRHAVTDQLTLKLLDFTLKAPAPQMSAEFCRQFC